MTSSLSFNVIRFHYRRVRSCIIRQLHGDTLLQDKRSRRCDLMNRGSDLAAPVLDIDYNIRGGGDPMIAVARLQRIIGPPWLSDFNVVRPLLEEL